MRGSARRTPRQLEKIISVFGPTRARRLLWRERWGDRSRVSLEYRGQRHFLRLNTTDPLVWFSVFLQEDYGAPLPFEPRVILDAGAYTGFSAIYLTNRWPQAEIIAVEPDPANFRLLKRNVATCRRIRPIQAALWFEDAELMLYTRPEGHWASSVHAFGLGPRHTGPSRAVAAMCVETLKARFGLERIDLLKIDIEGAEKELFEHSSGWIDEVGAIFIETHDRLRPGCSQAVAAATDGFDQTVVAPMTTLLVNRCRRGA